MNQTLVNTVTPARISFNYKLAMASKRQLYDRASEIQDKIKSAHLRQREIVQELTKFKSLNFEQLRWMEKPFFEIALSFQYEYATMGMDSGYPTPLPAGKAYPGQDGTFLATNVSNRSLSISPTPTQDLSCHLCGTVSPTRPRHTANAHQYQHEAGGSTTCFEPVSCVPSPLQRLP